jgi:hypothetical protein
MRYGVIAANPLERVGLAAGLVPTPRIDGYAAPSVGRSWSPPDWGSSTL